MQIINNTLQFYHPMIRRLFFMGTLVVYVMGSLTEIVIIIKKFCCLLKKSSTLTERFLSANNFFGYSFNTMTIRNKDSCVAGLKIHYSE